MKKLLMIGVAFFILSSCDKNETTNELQTEVFNIANFTKDQIANATLEEKINYKKYHMEVLASWVAKNNKAILNMASNQQKSDTDEPKTFFIEDLVKTISTKNKSSKTDENQIKLENSLNAFKELEGESWYPIIFQKDNQVLAKSSKSSLSTYMALEGEGDEGESLNAYELSSDNKLIPLNQTLTKEFVGNNNLLVMELVSCSDEIMMKQARSETISRCGGGGSGGGGTGGGGSSYRYLKLDKMAIKDLKEGWPFRSEISIKAYKLSTIYSNTTYECGDYVTSSVNCYTDTGNRIVRLKRKYKNDTRTYNWTIERSSTSSNDVIYYVIFEADNFPAPLKDVFIPLPNGSISKVTYRSWQGIYDKQTLAIKSNNAYGLPFAYNFEKDNSDIRYNLK
jgi:hypothetical protein